MSSGQSSAPDATGAAPAQPPSPLQPEKFDEMFNLSELSEEIASEIASGEKQLGRGEALVVAQLALLACVAFPPGPVQQLLDGTSIAVLLAGGVYLASSLFDLGRNLSPLPAPRKTHELVTKGAYATVRHPMYAGVLLAVLGLAGVTHSGARLALAALLWYVLDEKASIEEAALSERYPEYNAYKAKVKKFIPFIY